MAIPQRLVALMICLLGTVVLSSPALAAPPAQIHTVAGGGGCSAFPVSGGSCDNIAATSAQINGARSVAALPGGGYLFVDHGDDLVREVTATGKVLTVAGTDYVTNPATGATAPSLTDTDGVPATQSGLDDPVAVAALPGGGFLVTEAAGRRVRLVSPGAPGTATITTLVGIPPQPPVALGSANPGMPTGPACDPDTATSCIGSTVELNYPSDAVPTSNAGVLVADTFNHRVLLLSADSSTAGVATIAGGTGATCNDTRSTCDGYVASQLGLDQPVSISESQDQSGSYLITDQGANTVLQVSQESASGTVTTVAGQPGVAGYSGDGGAATSAELNQPNMALSMSPGVFVVADTGNNVVRQVSSGLISTIAGNGTAGATGDGGNATSAQLNSPMAVASGGLTGILVADDNSGSIREITQAAVSTAYFTPASPNGANGWYTVDPLMWIVATESASVSCIMDPNAAPTVFAAIPPGCTWTGGALVRQNGVHTLWMASEDSFADYEVPTSITVKVDTVPPTLTCDKEPSFFRDARSAKVHAHLTDSISGPTSATVKAKANTKRPGTHKVRITGTNAAGLRAAVRCPYIVRTGRSRKHRRSRRLPLGHGLRR